MSHPSKPHEFNAFDAVNETFCLQTRFILILKFLEFQGVSKLPFPAILTIKALSYVRISYKQRKQGL